VFRGSLTVLGLRPRSRFLQDQRSSLAEEILAIAFQEQRAVKLSVGLSFYSYSIVKDPRQVTPAEFTTIEVLWEHPENLSVGDVHTVLSQQRRVAYTTVMTLLDKMHTKRSVRRIKRGKAYYYRPVVRRQEVLDYLLQQFANSYCHGHREDIVGLIRDRTRAASDALTPAQYPHLEGRKDIGIELL
jgi:predicted transcriptional regulator